MYCYTLLSCYEQVNDDYADISLVILARSLAEASEELAANW